MDRYTARINAYGKTERERNVNRLKADINRKAFANPSMKSVLLNSQEIDLVVDDGTSVNYKKFSSLPNQIIKLGDYIEWNGRVFLVTSLNTDDEIYSSGIMSICMYRLRWQKKDGTIIERWCVPQDFTKYDSGQTANGVITIPSNQYGLIIPLDKETKMMPRDKRFVMDVITYEDYKRGAIPDTYMLTNEKPILNDYTYFNRGGTITYTTKFDAFNAETDKWIDGYGWICDYIEAQNPNLNPDIEKTEDDYIFSPIQSIRAEINGSNEIKTKKRAWNVTFYRDDEEITFDNFNWNIEYDEGVEPFVEMIPNEENIYSIGLKCSYDDIGKSFRLQVVSENNIMASINVDVIA